MYVMLCYVLEHQYGCCDVNTLHWLLFSQNLQRVGSCLFNIHFFTSNTIIKMIHIHSFDPEGAKISQSLYLLYFHLLNSHWPLAFAFLMFILTSLRTISSLFFFNCLAYCHGCLELLLLIVGGEHFRRKTLDQGEGHERSSKPCV